MIGMPARPSLKPTEENSPPEPFEIMKAESQMPTVSVIGIFRSDIDRVIPPRGGGIRNAKS